MQSPQKLAEGWMPLATVASELGIPESEVREMSIAGLFPVIRFSGAPNAGPAQYAVRSNDYTLWRKALSRLAVRATVAKARGQDATLPIEPIAVQKGGAA